MNAVEESFVLGNFEEAFADSKRCIVDLIKHELEASSNDSLPEYCRLVDIELEETSKSQYSLQEPHTSLSLSIYLQCIFELSKWDEMATATQILQAFAPLPFSFGMLWLKLLVAMKETQDARAMLEELRDRIQAQLGIGLETFHAKDVQVELRSALETKYADILEVLLVDIRGPESCTADLVAEIHDDVVLSEELKEDLARAVEAHSDEFRPKQPSHGPKPQHNSSQDRSQVSSQHPNDTSSSKKIDPLYVAGSVAVAALATVAAVKFRQDIRGSFRRFGTALSSSLEDTTRVLFGS